VNLSILVEEFIFKRRSIIQYRKSASCSRSVFCESMESVDVDALLEKVDVRLAHYLTIRRGSPQWVFFTRWDGDILQGYSFLHVPKFEEWNDSLPTRPGEARVSSNFVYPPYRGKGVRAQLLSKQYEYAESHSLKLWAVVENRNVSSIRAEIKAGFVARKNFLVKVLGRNFLSILTNPFEIYVILGSRRVKR